MADDLPPRRDAVLDEMLIEAPFEGWTRTALEAAAREAGEEIALPLLFPRGVADVLDWWGAREDGRVTRAFEADPGKPPGVTATIRRLVRDRILALEPDREAARRAAATLALPPYAATGTRMTWRTADRIWRAAGDTATDFNHYSKRAILSGVYASTAARWFADEGDGAPDPYQATWDFLDARLADVMRFEKVKAKLPRVDADGFAAALGRLRYGSGRTAR